MSRTILIVEDNGEERRIFSTYLRFMGGHILESTNGEEGVRTARERKPDLILMDLTMPVMDGWEAVRRLGEDPETQGIPVIAVTAHRLPPEQLVEAGFCGHLEKPLAPYRLLQEVERCLGPLHDGDAGTPAGDEVRPGEGEQLPIIDGGI